MLSKRKHTTGLAIAAVIIIAAAIGLLLQAERHYEADIRHASLDTLRNNTTEHLFGDTSKPACNIDIDCVTFSLKHETPIIDSVNKMILHNVYGESYDTLSPMDAMLRYASDYTANYRKEVEPMYRSGGGGLSAWYSYFSNIKGRVERSDENMLVYSVYNETYTGGAHSNYATSYMNIALDSLHQIDIDEIFNSGYSDSLSSIIKKQLMKDVDATDEEELLDMGYGMTGDIVPTDNFIITDSGITFHYNIYEIAPFVIGQIKVAVPYKDLKPLLNSDCTALKNMAGSDI